MISWLITPTARPSGRLWMVIASTNSQILARAQGNGHVGPKEALVGNALVEECNEGGSELSAAKPAPP
jgi:hypothetical protein